MNEKTAPILLAKLQHLCMSKTLTSKLHMKQHLYAHRLEKGAFVYEHLTVFKEVLLDLEAMEGADLIVCGRQEQNTNDNYYNNGELLVASVDNSKVSNEWILDSGSRIESTPQVSIETQSRVASSSQHSIAKNMPRREIKPPKWYAKIDLVAYALNVAKDIDANQDRSTYSEAVSYEGLGKWMIAMQEEMESLHKNKIWDLVKLPKGKKVVHCKWVFKKNEGTLGVGKPRYKARLVPKCYS
ncbi:hypothetical protein CXB51_004832 [Gossypium anomalum]|uniref:Reverse transcriptase Ty1/copia-type domain-containing protein n=1 Tax=Gossypium anomalum TaxID=47600 RepID=A0A8J6DBQ9_9ROSI|nr:hypothetical protein CXB51_004832 [Gossypium anomalum]